MGRFKDESAFGRRASRFFGGAISLVFIFAFPLCAAAEQGWEIVPGRTSIGFRVSHFLLTNVSGRFKSVSGRITTPTGEDFAHAHVDISIPISSVFTGNPDRDEHLKTADFFNAAAYPDMHFRSTKISQSSPTHFTMDGILTISGSSNPVHLDVDKIAAKVLPTGVTRIDFSATGTINRYDYGLRWNKLTETGGMVVGKEVAIQLDVSLQSVEGKSHTPQLARSDVKASHQLPSNKDM